MAKALSEECSFIAGFGAASEKERVTGDNIMFYDVEHGSAPVSEAVFLGALNNYDLVFKWAHDKCIPLVREITFENGEELTEEGKPFLILFHTSEDTQSLKYFQNEISRSLVGEEVINLFRKTEPSFLILGKCEFLTCKLCSVLSSVTTYGKDSG